MGEEFSTGRKKPSDSDIEAQNKSDWENYGAFIPQELRGTADEIFSLNNKNPRFFEDLSDEIKIKYLDLLKQYAKLSPYGQKANTERIKLRREIDKLLR